MCSAAVPIQIKKRLVQPRRSSPPLTPPSPPRSRDFQASSSPMMTPSKPASVIGADLAIVGQKITLVCQSALIVAGEVSGDIHGDDVTVGETGKVNGTVSARNLVHSRRDQRAAARRDGRALFDGTHQRRHRSEAPRHRRGRAVRRPRAQRQGCERLAAGSRCQHASQRRLTSQRSSIKLSSCRDR